MILSDFAKSVAQLNDPRFKRVLWLGLALTFVLLFSIYALCLWFLNLLTPDEIALPFFGEVAWVGDLLSVGSILLMIVLSIFLMVPVASLFTGFFLEDVADAVEARHYPHLPPKPRQPWWPVLKGTFIYLWTLSFAGIAAVMLSLFMPPLAPLIFYAVNGLLLGREYFQMAAARRLGPEEARAAFKDNMGSVWIAGVLMAVALSIPLLNLLIPILGAATFTHLFHRLVRLPGR